MTFSTEQSPRDTAERRMLRGDPPDVRSPRARRLARLALLARLLSLPAFAMALAAGLGLLAALAVFAGALPESWRAGRWSGTVAPLPETPGAMLLAAGAGLAQVAFLALLAWTLWRAGGWFRLLGEAPLRRAEAADGLGALGRLTALVSLAGLAVAALATPGAPAAGTGGRPTLDLTPILAAVLGLLVAGVMQAAAEEMRRGPRGDETGGGPRA
ncbi:hypothetical protein P2H44_11720 [Albimonas sp. CAU 1670]|uniref:hypothetical protein n=1 Tax=Albimonas sp. CAU 1670 TaxID=3032599 RepID=UPI0023DC41E8|nr:hypothetical protein [Albimonas sp. CAU 1670]MDF2233220.1 hypothetical protein [Albimonas sp. CAU 1670]